MTLSMAFPSDVARTVAVGLGAAAWWYAALRATKKDKYAGVNLPPGDLGWPLIGNLLEVRQHQDRKILWENSRRGVF